MNAPLFWRKCTTCKNPIAFAQKYWVCSVSTCNRARTGLVFCGLSCFDAHVPVLNHRDSGAFERRAPSLADWRNEQRAGVESSIRVQESRAANPEPQNPRPPIARPAESPSPAPAASSAFSDSEILVVASKVKGFIRERSGMNTSDSVMDWLSRRVRVWANDAIRRASQDGRKTVLDRDLG